LRPRKFLSGSEFDSIKLLLQPISSANVRFKPVSRGNPTGTPKEIAKKKFQANYLILLVGAGRFELPTPVFAPGYSSIAPTANALNWALAVFDT